VSRGSNGRETQEISDRGNQVCFGWANKPERNSDRLTRQWWLWFPAAGHQTTPQTLTKKWLDSVVDGSSTMSQRKTSSVEKHGGGINALKRKAKQRGVHLVRLEDDKGNDLIAASLKPFKVLS
jgi:hypothetical protein